MSQSLSTSSGASSHNNNNNNSIPRKDTFIYDIPPSVRQLLCDHLDELNVWNQLAQIMSLKPSEIQSIRRQESQGKSATDELLKIWGDQYNHTVTELFVVLKKQRLYQAMRLLKDFVERKYHLLIPNSQPVLSMLMAQDAQNVPNEQQSQKILNCQTSSGVSNSNNLNTSDDNYTSSSAYSTTSAHSIGNGNVGAHRHQQSTLLSERNVKEYAQSILEINYIELADATNNWSSALILGKGGFGTVYRGYFKHTDVAIKQIHYRGPNGRESAKIQLQQSLNELRYLNSCRHDNVLPLYGYSIKGEKPCLVYQLMKGGSLEQRLLAKNIAPLTWQQRIEICFGTSRGINYLHTFRDKPLIHGDIKPANVLLDQCLQAKIGDFGLAREGPNAVNSAIEVTQVFGTKPYLPPEFLNSKKLSTQVDTYSFGVVLLETFTGLRVYDRHRVNPLLTEHIIKICATAENKIEDLIDKNVPIQPNEMEVCKRLIQLGVKCIAISPQHRPEMEDVLKVLMSTSLMG